MESLPLNQRSEETKDIVILLYNFLAMNKVFIKEKKKEGAGGGPNTNYTCKN